MNLSTKPIDKNALQVLTDYGLKFTPVPRQNLIELKTDIKRFARKLRLIEFFADKDLQDDDSLVKPESNFTPNHQRDNALDTYIDEMAQQQNKKVKDNLIKKQWKGIMNLKNDKDIIIKESDKGGLCVIMDKTFYYEKMMEMLKDDKTYKELPKNIDNATMEKKTD